MHVIAYWQSCLDVISPFRTKSARDFSEMVKLQRQATVIVGAMKKRQMEKEKEDKAEKVNLQFVPHTLAFPVTLFVHALTISVFSV